MRDVPPAARTLGLAGLAPFAGLALIAAVAGAPWGPAARDLLAGYGATILAFMGGCRWGMAAAGMGEGPAMRPLALSVAPALWAWGALAAPAPIDLGLLALGLVGLYLADRRLTADGGAPAWWPALRLPLTAGAAASLVVGMVG